MNTGHDPAASTPRVDRDAAVDAGRRLARNRARLHERLAALKADRPSGALTLLGNVARTALPFARQAVRRNPYASLGGAALTGMMLMRWKPWRGLGGSFLVGLLVRQALAHWDAAGSRALGRLWSMTQAGRKTG